VGSIPKGTSEVKLIVPVLNRYDLLQRMVDSIDIPLELLVLDNGDALETLKVPAWVDARVLHLPNNLGVAASWNFGIKCFPFEPYWTFTAADTQFKTNALQALSDASAPNRLTLTHTFPFYQAFSLGEELVQNVGLFDESIYPIYFEDNDYERRVTNAGFEVYKASVDVHHDNASTINAGEVYARGNAKSYGSNSDYYHNKINTQDFSEGRWNLQRIRDNAWQK